MTIKVAYFATGFDVDTFVQHEAPVTFGLFQSDDATRKDLRQLFSYAEQHREAMPFYTFDAGTVDHMAATAEAAYDAMCTAMDWLAENPDQIPHYFGEGFCERYPEFIRYALWTYAQSHEALYGRFDMAMDAGTGQVTGIYEFNGDTPVMLFESTILQNWLTEQVNAGGTETYGQHNEFYGVAQEGLGKVLNRQANGDSFVGVLLHAEYIEDMATCETLFQLLDAYPHCAARIDHIDSIEYDDTGSQESPWRLSGVPLDHMVVLQPWEEIVESCYDDVIVNWRDWGDQTRFSEPAWRWFLANKGMLAVVTHLLETDAAYAERYGHLPFLPTYRAPTAFLDSGTAFVQKPLTGRLSNNIRIFDENGELSFESDGMYGEEPCVFQAYCAPSHVEGRNNFIIGQWMAPYESGEPLTMQAASLSIREFDKPVLDIRNERFIPHLIR